MRALCIFSMLLVFSVLLLPACAQAFQIRDPAVIPDSTGTKTTVSCALCHKEPLGRLWHAGIDYEMEMPEGQHTRRVQASIITIWHSLTVTADGMKKTGQLLKSLRSSERIDVTRLEEKLGQCERDFSAMIEKPATTEEQILERSSMLALKAQKVYMEEERLRRQGMAARALGLLLLASLAVLISILIGLLGMHAGQDLHGSEGGKASDEAT
jgi:hypothetical protein